MRSVDRTTSLSLENVQDEQSSTRTPEIPTHDWRDRPPNIHRSQHRARIFRAGNGFGAGHGCGARSITQCDSAAAIVYAVELWGAAAGGYSIAYTPLDDGIAESNGAWDATKEAENAAMVINDPNAVVYIGPYSSGAAEVSIPLTNETGMAQISPASTAVQLTKENPESPEGYPGVLYPSGHRTFFRVVPTDDLLGAAGANFAFNSIGKTNAFVLHDNQTYGKGVATAFKTAFESQGGSIAGFEGFSPDAPEYQALATKIANSGADLVYLGAIVSLNASKLLTCAMLFRRMKWRSSDQTAWSTRNLSTVPMMPPRARTSPLPGCRRTRSKGSARPGMTHSRRSSAMSRTPTPSTPSSAALRHCRRSSWQGPRGGAPESRRNQGSPWPPWHVGFHRDRGHHPDHHLGQRRQGWPDHLSGSHRASRIGIRACCHPERSRGMTAGSECTNIRIDVLYRHPRLTTTRLTRERTPSVAVDQCVDHRHKRILPHVAHFSSANAFDK
jgi:hypothetical protein